MQVTIEYDEQGNVGKISGFPSLPALALGIIAQAQFAINAHFIAAAEQSKKLVVPVREIPPIRQLNGESP